MTAEARACSIAGVALCGAILWGIQPAAEAQNIYHSAFDFALQNGTKVEISFSADPDLAGCNQVESTEDGQLWDCADHTLELKFARRPGLDLVSFVLRSRDGMSFNLHEHSTKVSVPASAGDALWTFNRQAQRDIMETNLARSWVYFSAANRGIPYMALVDSQGLNRLALGLVGQDHAVLLRGEASADKRDYVLTLRQTDNATAESFADTIYISHGDQSWYRDAQEYTLEVDRSRGYQPPAMPASVLNATYDTWYWTLDKINQELTWNMAVRSQALGFKTYLIDAGWDTHAGEYVKGLKGSTGDYMPPPAAFPDFPALLADIRGRLGMKVMLWMQQYAMGRRSIYYPEVGSSLCSISDPEAEDLAETPFLCPSTYATRAHMANLFGRILDDYRPDALWFDWQEEIPQRCAAPHFHDYSNFGDGYNATQRTIMEAIRQRSPEIFVDMRWPFANLNNKRFTHLWQPIDSAGDFEAMRLRAMVMRPFSSGVVMGTDEMYWDPKVTDAEAARYMAAVVFSGVPYFGPNLLEEPPSRTGMLKNWLRFYETHQSDLVGGNFSPYGHRDRPDQFIEGGKAAFIYYGNRHAGPLQLGKPPERLYIVNASPAPGMDLVVNGLTPGSYLAEISDLDLENRRSPSRVELFSRSRLQFDLPVGCLLTLTPAP